MSYEKPRQRPGHRLSFVRWDASGRVRETHYTRIDRKAEAAAALNEPAVVSPPSRRRGITVEQQRGLFDRD